MITERESPENEVRRLRRHLRAMAAVNRQLQAQLDGTGGRAIALPSNARTGDDRGAEQFMSATSRGGAAGLAAAASRRAWHATPWIEQLRLAGAPGQPFLVRTPAGPIVLVEGNRKREIRSGILAAALERHFGSARLVSPAELDEWSDFVPVDLLEGPRGAAFVVVGGRRMPIRGLPLPHPVTGDEMQLFAEGEELNVAAANVSRARFEHAVSGRYHVDRAKEAVARKGGLVPAGKAAARKVAARFRRSG